MEEPNDPSDKDQHTESQVPEEMEKWQLVVSSESPVKSVAVVKHSAVQRPATFAQLQCNTDLNRPPSNWLSSSAESYGLQHVPAHSSGFSSFRLAHMFPDCVGEVNVVSDAENIKKLLKIPYSRGAVSMMVHRVQNTLLIDQFDVHKLILQQAKYDWEWLRKFLRSNVVESMNVKENGLLHSHKRSALQNRMLVSKFLHHSLVVADPPPPPPSQPVTQLPVTTGPPLPDPQLNEELPDSGTKQNFLRNVVWTFEDIQMLLGTDMPIFGGSTHPCISLRLCDMSKPISVLTGIDYWLDNLMSNVPEVVMCFHLDGIVQRYELIKTEDLPKHSKFSPKLIRENAQHILSFLKTNAAKAGHTYWLFKGKDEDVVKLYDLTSLCSGSLDERCQNPFTVPVAMLLYRVARNMKHSSDTQHQRTTIQMLLDNCVRLLDAQKYPEIVTSAHYMLSDLYIPATIDPAAPVFEDDWTEEGNDQEQEEKTTKRGRTSSLSKGRRTHGSLSPRHKSCDGLVQPCTPEPESEAGAGPESLSSNSSEDDKVKALEIAAIKSLHLTGQYSDDGEGDEESSYTKPPPLASSVEEYCALALKHVSVGLKCLQFFGNAQEQDKAKDKENEEEEEPQMAKPFEPIPMPYSPLNSNSTNSNVKTENVKTNKAHSGKTHEDTKGTSVNIKKRGRKSSRNVEDKKDCVGKNEPQVEDRQGIKKLLCPSPAGHMPTWQTPDTDDSASWNAHLKILLYEKACLVYATLAEKAYASEKYGLALHMIGCVLRCREVLDQLFGPRPFAGLTSYLLGRAGDCCFMLVQRWASVDQHRHDLSANTGVDAEVEHEMFRDYPEMDSVDLNIIPEKIESMEQMLLVSLRCYERAKELNPKQDNLYRRIGNVHNELGVLYMSQAAGRYQELLQMQASNKDVSSEVTDTFKKLFAKSLDHLEAGVRSFECVADTANSALLHSNTGRLLRLCAHFHAPGISDGKEVITQERLFYNKALASYQKALQVLGTRKSNPDIWDTVTWELSTALYNLATLSQDYPGPNAKSQEDAERTAVELLQRALKYCDLETPGPRQPIYQFRAASLHHRLGSLYHRSYRDLRGAEDSRHARGVLQSCRLHYEKASEMFALLENPKEFFTVQLERVALAELQAQSGTSVGAKLRALQTALELLLASRSVLATIVARPVAKSEGGSSSTGAEKLQDEEIEKEELKLLTLFEQRLQNVLLNLAKKSSTVGKKDADTGAAMYKTMYSISLRGSAKPQPESHGAVSTLAKRLLYVIDELLSTFEKNGSK